MPHDRATVEQAAAAFRVLDAVRRARLGRRMEESRLARQLGIADPADDYPRRLLGSMPVRVGEVDFPATDWLGPYILMAAEREAQAVLLSLGVEVPSDA